MSSPSAPAETPRAGTPALLLPLQLVLCVAYPFLAHAATVKGSPWASIALADLVLLLLAALG